MLVLFLACAPNKGDSAMPSCDDVSTAVELDEVTELGFSAQQLVDLAIVPSPWYETLNWHHGGYTSLTLSFEAPTGAAFVESTAVYPEEGGADIGIVCADRVEVSVPLSFETVDGAFDESWDATLSSTDGETVDFRVDLDPNGLTGSYDITHDVHEDDWDEAELWVAGSFAEGDCRGDVAGQVSGTDPCLRGDACSAWVSSVEIGGWGD